MKYLKLMCLLTIKAVVLLSVFVSLIKVVLVAEELSLELMVGAEESGSVSLLLPLLPFLM